MNIPGQNFGMDTCRALLQQGRPKFGAPLPPRQDSGAWKAFCLRPWDGTSSDDLKAPSRALLLLTMDQVSSPPHPPLPGDPPRPRARHCFQILLMHAEVASRSAKHGAIAAAADHAVAAPLASSFAMVATELPLSAMDDEAASVHIVLMQHAGCRLHL